MKTRKQTDDPVDPWSYGLVVSWPVWSCCPVAVFAFNRKPGQVKIARDNPLTPVEIGQDSPSHGHLSAGPISTCLDSSQPISTERGLSKTTWPLPTGGFAAHIRVNPSKSE